MNDKAASCIYRTLRLGANIQDPCITLVHISLRHTNAPVISGCIACAQEHIYVLYAVPVSSVVFMILKAPDERVVVIGAAGQH